MELRLGHMPGSGKRTVSIRGDDPLAMFRSFVAVTHITRMAEGR